MKRLKNLRIHICLFKNVFDLYRLTVFHSRIEHYLEDYLYALIKDTDALISDGVLCMWSAWYFYDMADTVPDYIQE